MTAADSRSSRSGPFRIRAEAWDIAAFLAAPNLLFFAFSQFAFVVRPLVNLDFVLLGLGAGLLPIPATVFAYAVLLLVDAIVTLAPVFYFDAASAATWAVQVLRLGSSNAAQLGALVFAGAVVLTIVGTTLGVVRHSRHAPRRSLIVAGALLLGFDVLNGTSALSPRTYALVPFNVATSAAARLMLGLIDGARADRDGSRVLVIGPAIGASTKLRKILEGPGGVDSVAATNVVLVVVESLGDFADTQATRAVLAPLLSDALKRSYTVRWGSVAANGPTTRGELRELCGVDADYRAIGSFRADNCLPVVLKRFRFRTLALHGYTRSFFNRYEWYPLVGFERALFGEDMAAVDGMHRCGVAFRGICDVDVARIVHRQLRSTPSSERSFIYWLTLDSHFPQFRAATSDGAFDCEALTDGSRFEDVCALMTSLHRTLGAVADIAADPGLAPTTRFIVVGDHQPSFVDANKRAVFVSRRTLFIELVPRLAGRAR